MCVYDVLYKMKTLSLEGLKQLLVIGRVVVKTFCLTQSVILKSVVSGRLFPSRPGFLQLQVKSCFQVSQTGSTSEESSSTILLF